METKSQCTHGDVQLVGGSGSYEGNVQICNNGVWGWVCDNSWSSIDARVVCRQLGFSTTNVYSKYSSFYGYGNGTIWLDYMYCNGSENKLIDCNHAYDIGFTTCGYNEMAGVYCQSGGSCTNGDIRLANGYAGRSEGQVEVCQNQEWGKVCINGWDTVDATVACKQLGYDDSYNSFGGGSGMNDLGCNGTETSLFDCSGISLDIHSCSYSHTLRARCYSRDDSNCTDGDIRLWSAYDNTPENEGMIQICNSGTWYGMCDYSSCYVAKLACTQLGYAGAVGRRYNAGRYYGYYYYQDVYRYYCSSYYTSWSQCYKYYDYYCSIYYDSFGVVCYKSTEVEPLPSVCNDGDIQLVNGTNGTNGTNDEGRVEYCYNGTWVPVCSLTAKTASLMCQQLGHSQFTFSTIYSDERFGRSNIKSSFNYIYCSYYYTNFSQCSVRTKGGSCYISIAACSTEYSLRCYSPEKGCNDGDVRLVDGAIEQEGRPEVCFNGIWGSICRYSWDTIDSYVLCKTLGYDGPSPITYTYYSPFGSGDVPVVWNYVRCQGWEQDINDCSKTLYPGFSCYSTYYVVGVTCKESCVDNDVRLVGGDFNNEGTVEVCFGNLWGLISQEGWTEEDAKVICNQIGYKRGIAQPKYDSFYGKPKKTIHLRNVNCAGDENSFSECTKTRLSLYSGKLEQANTVVAGVDCIYDEPTEPPCIENPDIKPSDACNSPGSFRLMKKGSVSTDEGRFEYCYNGFWTPLCTMDNRLADVACRQLGHTRYSWGAIVESGEFGTLLNYSLIVNITCSGSESFVSDCTPFATDDNCLPWCPHNNVGLRCFDTGDCEEGTIRLVDGIIEQEGRVEVCIDSVWGSVCDEGWDKTDAHVVCRQMGHPVLEPIVFLDSYFGNGQYPIIYSNMKCGGWESNIHDCQKETFLELKCPSRNVAGVLCGYDCEDGDVRLVGGTTKNEGTVEVCFDNLWGLIEEAKWSDKDAEIVCKQLGYEVEDSTAYGSSQYGKPNKTVHLTNVQCIGDEERINECTQTSYSLQEGKNKLKTVDVAGVKCYVSNECVSPPIGGTACVNGDIRLTGTNLNSEGVLEYCYKGLWSTFCSLGEREAIVACRQLGYIGYDLVSIFNDGRFDSYASNISYFENITCSQSHTEFSLSECDIVDSCQSSCKNAVGIRCFEFANCEEGAVRLMDGDNSKGGRIEVCADNIWGSICSDGFDKTDAYVVCKELDLGESEPTVFTNSYFGDGDLPIVYSNMECRGYENTVLECTKQEFGTFTCSRDKVVGITCQDGCENGIVRLVGGREDTEGTVEICYYNIWGLVAVHGWDNNDAAVVCNELGFTSGGAVSFTDSHYGKPNKTVHLSNVECSGLEDSLKECDASHIPPDEGSDLFQFVDVVGVSCSNSISTDQTTPSVTPAASKRTDEGSMTIGLIIIVILFVITVVVVVCLTIYIMFKRKSTKQKIQNLVDAQHVTMSSIDDREDHEVINPETLDIETLDDKCILAD